MRLAFETYAPGKVSDTEVAHRVNREGYRTKKGRLFSNETMRDLLQNRTYLGYVRYQPYQRNSNGSRNVNAEVQ